MSRVSRILGADGKPYRYPARPSPRRAEYDAARTTDENRRHWLHSDALSARSANSLEVRKPLRERARYESANNSYCRGMVLTRANDLVGTGPRLQMLGDDREGNRRVEKALAAWACCVRLAEKLRTAAQTKIVDGEPFFVLGSNPDQDDPVHLDLQLIECDRFTEPAIAPFNSRSIDGVEYDRRGNPLTYKVLREHPGDSYFWSMDFDTLPARYVIHWFRADRPGQVRGVPEITPALPLFAQLRRFTLATLTAAEMAACFAGLLETEAPANPEDAEEPRAWEALEVERGMLTTLPSGAKLSQLDPKHPATTYDMFKREIITEAGRCLDMPYNKAAGDSARSNFASGRLDHQTYFRSLQVERKSCEEVVLNRLFRAWLDEAVMVPGLLPDGFDVAAAEWRWFWDGWQHVDPVKEAKADEIRVASHMTTLAAVYAERGEDWEDALQQRARELKLMRELGIEQPGPVQPPDREEAEEEAAYAA